MRIRSRWVPFGGVFPLPNTVTNDLSGIVGRVDAERADPPRVPSPGRLGAARAAGEAGDAVGARGRPEPLRPRPQPHPLGLQGPGSHRQRHPTQW